MTPIRILIRTPQGTQTVVRDGSRIVVKMENFGRKRQFVVRELGTAAMAASGMRQLFDVARRFNGRGVRVQVAYDQTASLAAA